MMLLSTLLFLMLLLLLLPPKPHLLMPKTVACCIAERCTAASQLQREDGFIEAVFVTHLIHGIVLVV